MSLENLALRRPALQSSVSRWSTDQSVAVDAAVAVSGDPASARLLHTAHEFFPWWQVDLGAPSRIARVEIENRPDFEGRPDRLTLLGSLDGRSWRGLGRVRGAPAACYAVAFETPRLARFLRLRLDGFGALRFRQCLVWGEAGDDPQERTRYARLAAAWAAPAGRSGEIANVGGFDVFIDDAYAEPIRNTLRDGSYEVRERLAVCRMLRPGDRVMEAGSAIGLVAMTAAAIVGPANVAAYDANPAMTADAAANFARNGMRVDLHAGALVPRRRYAEGARLAFHVSPEFWASRLVEEGAPGAIQVPTLCFEAERERRQADVLICDIEGGEVALLSEADLTGFRLVILETHAWAVGQERADALIRKLALDGFNVDLDVSGQGVAALRR
jgi:FkbM family methyltransferase